MFLPSLSCLWVCWRMAGAVGFISLYPCQLITLGHLLIQEIFPHPSASPKVSGLYGLYIFCIRRFLTSPPLERLLRWICQSLLLSMHSIVLSGIFPLYGGVKMPFPYLLWWTQMANVANYDPILLIYDTKLSLHVYMYFLPFGGGVGGGTTVLQPRHPSSFIACKSNQKLNLEKLLVLVSMWCGIHHMRCYTPCSLYYFSFVLYMSVWTR